MQRHIVFDVLQHIVALALVRSLHGALPILLGNVHLDRLQTLRPLQRQSQWFLRRCRSDSVLSDRLRRVVDVAFSIAKVAVKVQALDAAHVGAGFAVASTG